MGMDDVGVNHRPTTHRKECYRTYTHTEYEMD